MTGSSRADLLSSRVRRQIVEAVRDSPGQLAAADLARLTELHVTTVRFHLEQLEQAGVLVAHRQHRATVGRPRNVYSPAAESVPVNDTAYAVLAQVLASALPQGAERIPAAVAAGEAWASSHIDAQAPVPGEATRMPVRELVDVLARWGYPRETVTIEESPAAGVADEPGTPGVAGEPGRAASAGEPGRAASAGYHMSLSHCPMLDGARAHPDVVCGAHLGLVRGTLDRLGVPGADVTVTPMARPGLCMVDVLWSGGPADAQGRAVLNLAAVEGFAD